MTGVQTCALPICGLANAPEDATAKMALGYQFLSFGSDALFLREGALAAAKNAKEAIG